MAKKEPNQSGYYKKSFVAGYVGGAQKRITVYGKTEREVNAKLLAKKMEFEQGKLLVNGDTTFEAWSKQWLETYKKPHVEINSYRRYKTIIKKHLSMLNQLALKDIKPVMLQRLINDHQGQSKSNVKKIYLTLKQIFKQAVINDLIIKDPTVGVTMPQTTEGTRRALTEDERKLFLEVAENHRAGVWILMMLCCGLRKGETIPLTWADVDFKKRYVSVSKAVTFVDGKAVVKSVKTKAGNRIVPIPDVLLSMLKKMPRRDDTTLVFTPARSGGMLTHNHTIKMWSSFIRDVDIKAGAELYRNKIIEHAIPDDITPHTLRHTYATDLYKMGVDLKTAQSLLGHSDIRMTADIYTHTSEETALNILPLQNKLYEQKTGVK